MFKSYQAFSILVLASLIVPAAISAPGGTPDAKKQQLKQMEQVLGRKIEIKPTNFRPITVTGEVVDSWCYISETMGPGRGDKHAVCATACGNGGVPLGIVDDKGQIYIAAKSKQPFKGCKELLMPYIAQRVKVTGYVASKGGCQVLRIEKVEKAK
jgi:hypothetical protein